MRDTVSSMAPITFEGFGIDGFDAGDRAIAASGADVRAAWAQSIFALLGDDFERGRCAQIAAASILQAQSISVFAVLEQDRVVASRDLRRAIQIDAGIERLRAGRARRQTKRGGQNNSGSRHRVLVCGSKRAHRYG
ncbi:hypothetical protein [Lysobacter gummosus]|uniref:Uncharacterized protein n=1 Tax=Lysobacter gummosus TaxID=262324 RepID=A0ABY3XJB3_9GAMM|nr:hypothetical protein [Lysobacter gummosus]UNP31718.1 hypothetical protein MOV92_10910 [Lysobacter gummosus]